MTRLVHKLQTWNSIKAKQSQPLNRKEIGESTEVAPSLNRYVVESRTRLVDTAVWSQSIQSQPQRLKNRAT